METLALDTDSTGSDIYISLGIKRLGKAARGSPRVLSLLSSLLERHVQRNEILLEAAEVKDVVTVFHGLRAPCLSIQQYVDRIYKYAGCSTSCFVVAHIYVDRFVQRTEVQLTSLSVHRLLITSIMLAAKFNDDVVFNNAYYARVGGVSTGELNRMEVKFLSSIDFRLHVDVETFRRYCLQLDKESVEEFQIERPVKACGIKDVWSQKEDSSTCAPTVAR